MLLVVHVRWYRFSAAQIIVARVELDTDTAVDSVALAGWQLSSLVNWQRRQMCGIRLQSRTFADIP